MPVIAIANQKGGIGKTTTAVSLATGIAKQGYKTLLIDTDSQCNSTDTYRAAVKDTATLYNLLFEGEKAVDCVQHTKAGGIIPCDSLMESAEQRFPNDNSRSFMIISSLTRHRQWVLSSPTYSHLRMVLLFP